MAPNNSTTCKKNQVMSTIVKNTVFGRKLSPLGPPLHHSVMSLVSVQVCALASVVCAVMLLLVVVVVLRVVLVMVVVVALVVVMVVVVVVVVV